MNFGNFTYDFEGPGIETVTFGYYDDLCDLCLFDRHYCAICQDVVGHNHEHLT